MPVLALASPKGGCGKTTTSLVLATTLAEMGASVILFDCDRNRPHGKRWSADKMRSKLPLTVIEHTDELTIVDALDEARTKVQFVVCDLEGTGSTLMSRAIGRSQFVIIPLQPSDLDADEAAKAINLIRVEERSFGRKIAHRVLWTRTKVVAKPKIERMIMAELEKAGAPIFTTQINEREPFRVIMRGRCGLSELTSVVPDLVTAESVEKAQDNARAFVQELLGYLAPAKDMAA